jgi:hypothetical protein
VASFIKKISIMLGSLLARLLLLTACFGIPLIVGIVYAPALTKSLLVNGSSAMVYTVAVHTLIYGGLALVLVGCILAPMLNLVMGWPAWLASVVVLIGGLLAVPLFFAAAQGLWVVAEPTRLVNYTIWSGPQFFTPRSVGVATMMFLVVAFIAGAHMLAVWSGWQARAQKLRLAETNAPSEGSEESEGSADTPLQQPQVNRWQKPNLPLLPPAQTKLRLVKRAA